MNVQQPSIRTNAEDGYALPSVLIIVTFLFLMSSSVILIHYFENKLAWNEVAALKAHYAAQSGVAKTLSTLSSHQEGLESLLKQNHTFEFEDGSRASIMLKPWGAFLVAESLGEFRKTKSTLMALIAEKPAEMFKNALIFGNSKHQLVLAGLSSITGDVLVGQHGATVGTLRGLPTPPKLPISGIVKKGSPVQLPIFRSPFLEEELRKYWGLLQGQDISGVNSELQPVTITDSVNQIMIDGDFSIEMNVLRRQTPLYIVVDGKVKVNPSARLQGLVAVVASGEITIEKGSIVDYAVLTSQKSVRLMKGAVVTAQLLAPSIIVERNSSIQYPSILLSVPSQAPANQEIVIQDSAFVEGTVALVSTEDAPLVTGLITLSSSARVIGSVYSCDRVTLDGTVIGTVLTKDFYFYQPPTTYYGWVRSGRIDRLNLPAGFFVPPGFSQNIKFGVLDWL